MEHPVAASHPPNPPEAAQPRISPILADLACAVLRQCGVTVLDIGVAMDFKASEGEFQQGGRVWGGALGEDGGLSVEAFVSSLVMCARPPEGRKDGVKLVVRLEQVCEVLLLKDPMSTGSG